MPVSVSRLATRDDDFDTALGELLRWEEALDAQVDRVVAEIIRDVRSGGDQVLLALTERFDGLKVDDSGGLRIGASELEAAYKALPDAEREALTLAAERIRSYHEHQRQDGFEYADDLGNRLGQRVVPLERVGVYVPGGQAAYPSTVLMTVIPARVAGVDEVIMVVPTPAGERSRLVLGAAHLAGVDAVFTVGGAQAIAALAYGTETIPKVDKIVGPGGTYVAAAKRMVFGAVGIDVIAGPSEVLIVADGTAPAHWMALDLFSQAEHDPAAQALLISPSGKYLDEVAASMDALLEGMARTETIAESLSRRGALIQADDLQQCIEIANRIAPEHLELAVADPRALLEGVRNAGAVFLGARSAEVVGDYSAGPSHVLPTFGTARFSSPLGVYDFVKRSSVIELSESGSSELARPSALLARGEGLEAHARAAEVRIEGFGHND
tara:strand:- start:231 stop:1550 length:1320 start_codon:yes stop_codon:yes gene_type:complete